MEATIHEQTATPVIINSRHLASLSRHFPASVLSQEPREESTPLSLALREDRTSQLTLERRQFDEDEKFEQQLLQSAGLWNFRLVMHVVALARKALSASKQATALLAQDSEKSESKSLLERRAKNRSAPKPNSLDSEVYVPQKTNAKKKMKQGFDTDDALQLFLWGPETKQLLTANEEAELITHIQVSCFTHSLSFDKAGEGKAKLESQNGCEPTLGEWAEAMGLSGPLLKSEIHRGRTSRERLITSNLRLVVHIAKQYQNCGLNFQDLLLPYLMMLPYEGSMGLMKSVEKFKPQSGCRFATYAYWWIRQSIRKSIFQNSRTIRLPIARVPTWVPSRVPGSPGGRVRLGNVPNTCAVNPGRHH
ncbi:hypothetical protein Bca52824_043093 [Brassica carinata]|uniref:RNA polymerase sigma-70 region 2 domain-containing protein n=1 Tax=Brassica carinata TaxID=52824 RepID=A0A8X7S2T7_BRACI|nr:hypothetical protein Bca52824_043093 [Brassica carinata]